MKKFIITLFISLLPLSILAKDSLCISTTVDTLTLKITQLEHEVIFMKAENTLILLKQDLENLNFSLGWTTNRIMTLTADKKYKKDCRLINAWMQNYNASYNLYLTFQKRIKQTNVYMNTLFHKNLFNQNEISYFIALMENINEIETLIMSSFELYKNTIIEHEKRK